MNTKLFNIVKTMALLIVTVFSILIYAADGYSYVNGFCTTVGVTKTNINYYEEPVLITSERCKELGISDDYAIYLYYEVKNAGNMYWISKYFSTIENNRKYVMTSDIDMEGNNDNHKDWKGIATIYSSNGTTHFLGVFDGLGHKFYNYYLKVSSGNYISVFGIIQNGEIKNFSISGNIEISCNNGAQYGVVIGRVNGGTSNMVEDIYSTVNINVDLTKLMSAIGGIIGQCSGPTTINRCRYSGVINAALSYNGIGGIIGNAENPITVNNCLFDGVIRSNSLVNKTTDDDGIKIGGLCSRNNNTTTIINSMSIGSIIVNPNSEAVDESKSHVGIILGVLSRNQKLIINNTFYSLTSCTNGIKPVGLNCYTNKTICDPSEINTQSWNSIRVALGQDNWKPDNDTTIKYPIPGIGGPILLVITISFNTNGGTAVTSISDVVGSNIVRPNNPTKIGHTFIGWTDENGNIVDIPSIMPSYDITLYAAWSINQYTITFDGNGGSETNSITQDYGTVINKPANPYKENWDFDGWSPAIPSTMPAENLICVAQWSRETYDDNGFNTNWDKCAISKKYEAPLNISIDKCVSLGIDTSYATNDYYEVKNAGNLYWIATNFNADIIENINKRKYVMTSDIDMEGNNSNHKDWPGIGDWNGGISTKHFMGVFDGAGHTINNYYMKITSGNIKGLFCVTNGDVIIKDFHINGTIDISVSGTLYGVIIGRTIGGDKTKLNIEDVHSSVNINVANNITPVSIGGIIGLCVVSTSINRCRYNGNINANIAYKNIGGIFGNAEHIVYINNCLFDGQIISNSVKIGDNDDAILIGGIGGRNNRTTTIINSLILGDINVNPNSEAADTTKSHSGTIFGYQMATTLTITNTFYKSSKYLKPVGLNNSSDKTKVTPTKLDSVPNWSNIHTLLGADNWYIDSLKYGKSYPIPVVHKHNHIYDQYGFCTECKLEEPIGNPVIYPDGNTYYIIDHFADLRQFTIMVNNSKNGTILNAKVSNDIDLLNSGLTINMSIGYDKDHRYCGIFDGQGHTLSGINIISDKRYVGLFACVGIADTIESKVKSGIVKNFNVSGTIMASYFSKWYTNTPLVMGVIGEVYDGVVENVHSSINYVCTSGTRSHIGGVVGGSLHVSNECGNVLIKNCTYEGTMNLNACDAIGGIVGYVQHKTKITNTMFAGQIIQNYIRPKEEECHGTTDTCSTFIGGVLGYTNSGSNGILNCVLVGKMQSNLNILSNISDGMMYKPGNNMNACVGYDGQIKTSYINYYGNYVSETYNTNYHQYPAKYFKGSAKVRTALEFATGIVCAELNEDSVSIDNPWGQILGYQVSGNRTPGSPALQYPFPGYTDPAMTSYKVDRIPNEQEPSKYDYIVDYYYFDDAGDDMPIPSNAVNVKVKKISYTRPATYVKEYMSICMPFTLTKTMLPPTAKIYQYSTSIEDDNEIITRVNFSKLLDLNNILAGEPVFIHVDTTMDWTIDTVNIENPIPIVINPNNGISYIYENNQWMIHRESERIGINGSFNTTLTDIGYYKLHTSGTKLVKTLKTSHCYPYRTYVKLPDNSNNVSYVPVRFIDEIIINQEQEPTTDYSYIKDKQVNKVIINGNIYIIKSNNIYTIAGQKIR